MSDVQGASAEDKVFYDQAEGRLRLSAGFAIDDTRLQIVKGSAHKYYGDGRAYGENEPVVVITENDQTAADKRVADLHSHGFTDAFSLPDSNAPGKYTVVFGADKFIERHGNAGTEWTDALGEGAAASGTGAVIGTGLGLAGGIFAPISVPVGAISGAIGGFVTGAVHGFQRGHHDSYHITGYSSAVNDVEAALKGAPARNSAVSADPAHPETTSVVPQPGATVPPGTRSVEEVIKTAEFKRLRAKYQDQMDTGQGAIPENAKGVLVANINKTIEDIKAQYNRDHDEKKFTAEYTEQTTWLTNINTAANDPIPDPTVTAQPPVSGTGTAAGRILAGGAAAAPAAAATTLDPSDPLVIQLRAHNEALKANGMKDKIVSDDEMLKIVNYVHTQPPRADGKTAAEVEIARLIKVDAKLGSKDVADLVEVDAMQQHLHLIGTGDSANLDSKKGVDFASLVDAIENKGAGMDKKALETMLEGFKNDTRRKQHQPFDIGVIESGQLTPDSMTVTNVFKGPTVTR